MKKAQLITDNMRDIIIALAVIVILAGFVYGVRESIAKSQDSTKCKASVKSYSATKTLKELASVHSEIECPAEDLLIDNRDMGQAKHEIAESMRRCWDNYGRGELELFSGQGIFCSVCSVIEFKKKDKHISGFTGYLMSTNIPGQQVSYMDFIQNRKNAKVKEYYDNPNLYDKNDPKLKSELDAAKLYSAVFIYARGEKWTRQVHNWFGSSLIERSIGGGVSGAGIAGAGVVGILVLGWHPPGWLIIGILAGGGAIGATLTTIAPTEPPAWLALAALTEFNEQELKAIGCTNLPVRAFEKT